MQMETELVLGLRFCRNVVEPLLLYNSYSFQVMPPLFSWHGGFWLKNALVYLLQYRNT